MACTQQSRRLRTSLIPGASLVFTTLIATAAPPQVHPIRLVYRAFAGCPSEAEFLDQVGARIAGPSVLTRSPQGQVVIVKLSAAQGGVVGNVETSTQGGASGSRAVRGRTCAEVASALALFTALSIDPRLAEKTDAPAAPSSADAQPPPTSPSATPVTPARGESALGVADRELGDAAAGRGSEKLGTATASSAADQGLRNGRLDDARLAVANPEEAKVIKSDTNPPPDRPSGPVEEETMPRGVRLGAGESRARVICDGIRRTKHRRRFDGICRVVDGSFRMPPLERNLFLRCSCSGGYLSNVRRAVGCRPVAVSALAEDGARAGHRGRALARHGNGPRGG